MAVNFKAKVEFVGCVQDNHFLKRREPIEAETIFGGGVIMPEIQ